MRSDVTIRDVARLVGVHPGTVSRVLNPVTRGLVKQETAERVMDAVEALGYQPNPIARGLKTNRSLSVGVVIPDLTNPLFPPMVRGIESVLDAAHYVPLIANTDNDVDRERACLTSLRSRQVDGLIVATARLRDPVVEEILAQDIPLVLINRTVHAPDVLAVVPDDALGMRLAVEHLRSLGHERIAHVGGPLDLSTGLARSEGFQRSLAESGVGADRNLIEAATAFTEAAGRRACNALLDRARGFTAIAAANDLLALGCLDLLIERGLRCPEDVSVIGFNDMAFVTRITPRLTTIRLGQHEMGALAAELLLEHLQRRVEAPHTLLVEPELVVRASTGPPRTPPAGRPARRPQAAPEPA